MTSERRTNKNNKNNIYVPKTGASSRSKMKKDRGTVHTAFLNLATVKFSKESNEFFKYLLITNRIKTRLI
jgi:hypothetical protein